MKVSRKGAVVIPRAIRERLGIHEGAEVLVSERDGAISIVMVPEDPIEFWHGRFRGGPSASQALVEEHHQEVAEEEHVYREWAARVERAPQ
jgi:AbrB family looped-hinge helix DNA binding protein